MVLHGSCNITIVDDALVTPSDLQTNFFCDQGSVGKPRAEVICKNLQELNPSAKFTPIVAPLASKPGLEALPAESVVISFGNLPETLLGEISAICRAKSYR
jgi:molybdopterin/thiamine biosynthesis adenylyltransferase